MTREEAIKEIEDRVQTTEYIGGNYVDCVDIEALRMAIEALQRSDHIADGGKKDEHFREVTKKMDVISRQAAIDAVRNFDDCENGYSDTYDKAFIISALEELPHAQPEIEERMEESAQNVPNGELISRKAAIDAVNKMRDACDTESLDDYRDLLVECFEVLPSAQPELIEKAAYIRGVEQGRTQGMIDSQRWEEMNKQRKVLITIAYNDLGCIVDTKAEPYEEPNLQPTCNQLATDCISRKAAIAVADYTDYRGLSVDDVKKVTDEVVKGLKQLPSAQPEVLACGSGELYAQPEPEGNSIHDLEELAEKVGSATVYDAAKEERTEEHAEMHACDSIHDIEELAKKVGVATIEEARNEAKKDDPYKHDTDLISRRAAIDIINRIENMDPKAKGGITVNLALLPALHPEPELKGEILEVVEMLKEKYEEAKKTRHINKPLEYALSETWQEFRRRNEVMR